MQLLNPLPDINDIKKQIKNNKIDIIFFKSDTKKIDNSVSVAQYQNENFLVGIDFYSHFLEYWISTDKLDIKRKLFPAMYLKTIKYNKESIFQLSTLHSYEELIIIEMFLIIKQKYKTLF